MNEEKSKKKPTSLEFVEERLEEFSKRISKTEKKVSKVEDETSKGFQKYLDYFDLLNVIVTLDMLITTKQAGSMLIGSGSTSDFDIIIDHIKEKEMKVGGCNAKGMTVYCVPSSSQINFLLMKAKNWKIPFEQISSYLIGRLGKKLAREIVEKTSIVEHYGKESLPIWEKLLEE